MSLLQNLPLELFQAIIQDLDLDSLATLSVVNKGIRSLCLPFLFKCVAVTFSTADFDSLLELVLSPVGRHVKALKYYTPPILKDRIPKGKSFRAFYSPDQYIYDQSRDRWQDENGVDVRYSELREFLTAKAKDHEAILQNGTDFVSLTAALQKLPNLSELIWNHNWRYRVPPKFQPVLPRIIQPDPGRGSFERHLSVCLQAIHLSHLTYPVTSFELSFWRAKTPCLFNFQFDQSQICLMQKTFAKIESLALRESEALLFFECCLKYISMPELRKLMLDFAEDEIDLSDVEEFCKRNGRHLQVLGLRCSMGGGYTEVGETSRCDPPLAICYPLYRIGDYCSLRKAHCKLRPWYHQSDKLEALLLRKIARKDIPHVFPKQN